MSSLALVLVFWFLYLRLRCSLFFLSTNGAIVTWVFLPQRTSQQKINIRVWLGGCWVSCSDLFTHQSWMYWVVSCFFHVFPFQTILTLTIKFIHHTQKPMVSTISPTQDASTPCWVKTSESQTSIVLENSFPSSKKVGKKHPHQQLP